ncbi:enoyl-CoA hydratase-related protein [Rhodococcus koreensis]|uniref:enoyl-CoA hydratase-related protein n=2 Tax=Rhodococcus TaxID=1827 RepID=UPI00197D59A4|nr:enoyl-CoA hydratase-related protein [Rhodococcus koreensis]QSE86428.1 enoyl-CoA hydratase/isomerase family protein [Rhodococcus koreensis]
MPDILYEVSDNVAFVTLNRPENLNAVTTAMCDALIDAFDAADADDSVRAVVVTGSGRAFCAGADLSSGGDSFNRTNGESGPPRDTGGRVTLRIFRSLKPVIAAINGPAVGFGASLTLPMDIRVAADSAKIGFPFTARGIVPDGAASWFLPRVVGPNRALDWAMTGRVFRAKEALEAGLVRSLHPAEEVLAVATEIAQEIARSAAPVSVALTRQLLWQMMGADHPMVAHEIESAAIAYTGSGPDAAEGVKAFLDKRTPVWTLNPGSDLPEWFPWRPEPAYEGIERIPPSTTRYRSELESSTKTASSR